MSRKLSNTEVRPGKVSNISVSVNMRVELRSLISIEDYLFIRVYVEKLLLLVRYPYSAALWRA